MADRLQAVVFDEDVAYERQRSRFRLTREFLRRTALWPQALGVEEDWPFGDLGAVLDPESQVDPALVEKLQLDTSSGESFPVPPKMAVAIVRWAGLGDLPQQRFPELEDPYEPLVARCSSAAARTPKGAWRSSWATARTRCGAWPTGAALEPAPIDAAALNALDEEELR